MAVEEADDTDEVVAEYPLYSSTSSTLFRSAHDPGSAVRVVQLLYPLRPPWRAYDTEHMSDVNYKPEHRVLKMKVPEGNPEKPAKDDKKIPLSGQGTVPEVPLCALVKVEGCFVLVPVDEVTQMRPDMEAYVSSAFVGEEVGEVRDEDPDYAPKSKSKAFTSKASTSKAAATKTVKVEVKKRETDRQLQLRARSYTNYKEQLDAEEAVKLKTHGATSGAGMIPQSAKNFVQSSPGEVAMGVPRKEFLKYVSPTVWLQRRARKAVTAAGSGQPATATAGSVNRLGGATAAAEEAPPPLDEPTIAALKQALEDLFAEQQVVTMRDVRVWLQAYTANVKARMAALQSDATISGLLVGGGSVTEIRGRFVLTAGDDSARKEIVGLLKVKPEGVRKAEALAAVRAAGLEVTEHAVSRTLRQLCVAVGAVWHLKEGATFAKKL